MDRCAVNTNLLWTKDGSIKVIDHNLASDPDFKEEVFFAKHLFRKDKVLCRYCTVCFLPYPDKDEFVNVGVLDLGNATALKPSATARKAALSTNPAPHAKYLEEKAYHSPKRTGSTRMTLPTVDRMNRQCIRIVA